jgi:hypothetical protein
VSDANALQASVVPHPIRLVNNDDLKRNRLTVFFRLILAIPHFIWLSVWLLALYVAGFFFWLIALIAGRLPDGIHEFVARFTRYSTHVYAYISLLSDPFPPFARAEGSYRSTCRSTSRSRRADRESSSASSWRFPRSSSRTCSVLS